MVRVVTTNRGVSLLEVVVALTILSTVLVSLSGIMWQMGRQTRQSGVATHRSTAMESAAALAASVPWDSLGSVSGCTADTLSGTVFTRCVDVAFVSTRIRRVRAVITASGAGTPPETLLVFRNRPLLPNPLDVQ